MAQPHPEKLDFFSTFPEDISATSELLRNPPPLESPGRNTAVGVCKPPEITAKTCNLGCNVRISRLPTPSQYLLGSPVAAMSQHLSILSNGDSSPTTDVYREVRNFRREENSLAATAGANSGKTPVCKPFEYLGAHTTGAAENNVAINKCNSCIMSLKPEVSLL